MGLMLRATERLGKLKSIERRTNRFSGFGLFEEGVDDNKHTEHYQPYTSNFQAVTHSLCLFHIPAALKDLSRRPHAAFFSPGEKTQAL